MRWKSAVFLFSFVLMVLLLGGCRPSQPTPPEIARVEIEPTVLSMLGGVVTIRAEVSDPNEDLESVVSEITAPDGTKATVILKPTEKPSVYRGTYRVPGNPRKDGRDMVYRVTIKASDAKGLNAERPGGEITVRAILRPPKPPFGD